MTHIISTHPRPSGGRDMHTRLNRHQAAVARRATTLRCVASACFAAAAIAVTTSPAAASTSGAAALAGLPCTNGYVCLYRDVNWQGTRWQFRDHFWQDLNPYGGSDQVCSWSNRESRTAYLLFDRGERLALAPGADGSIPGCRDKHVSAVLP